MYARTETRRETRFSHGGLRYRRCSPWTFFCHSSSSGCSVTACGRCMSHDCRYLAICTGCLTFAVSRDSSVDRISAFFEFSIQCSRLDERQTRVSRSRSNIPVTHEIHSTKVLEFSQLPDWTYSRVGMCDSESIFEEIDFHHKIEHSYSRVAHLEACPFAG